MMSSLVDPVMTQSKVVVEMMIFTEIAVMTRLKVVLVTTESLPVVVMTP